MGVRDDVPTDPASQLLTGSAYSPHRLRGPQRVFDLHQNMGSVNVSVGCTPAQLIQTSRARAQKVGPRVMGAGLGALAVKQLANALWSDLCLRFPAAVASPARTSPARHPGSLGLFRMHTSLGDPCPVTCSLRASPRPAGIGKVGPANLGWDWRHCPLLTPCLAFRLHLSMLVRPHAASQGVLLSAVPRSGHSPSLVLFLNHGRFVAQTEGPGLRLQAQSRQHSRAGQWHRVRG